MKKRFYESTIALNIPVIHNKNNFSFHTPLEKTPGIELPGVFLFIDCYYFRCTGGIVLSVKG
jgi:hypothetical protein